MIIIMVFRSTGKILRIFDDCGHCFSFHRKETLEYSIFKAMSFRSTVQKTLLC